jgi:hypothetical protein
VAGARVGHAREVIDPEVAVVEQLLEVRGVVLRVAQQAAQQAELHVPQLVGGPRLGLAQVPQQRHRRPTAHGLERREQRLC